MHRIFEDWSVEQLKNAIWMSESLRMVPMGGYDTEEYRKELRLRGLSDRGYHNS